MSGISIWGGIECTFNRVGEVYFDQMELSGHHRRESDLDRVAELGIRALRYPVLWERTTDFAFSDERLNRLRALGVEPIVGLVHHGSGPPHTSLVDEGFVEGLAAFARKVAERYPWVRKWTPVNEPLTTARFACLYGHWYPHRSDEGSFLRAVSIQCRAIARAMEEIRKVIPGAELVQTEDVAHVFSTEPLAYQVEYENDRRWLTFDLLAGRVDRRHPFFERFLHAGVPERDLDLPCPPDLVGLNYYLTSDRFLDHRLERYPAHFHGGNGRDRYADLEAVRVLPDGVVGHRAALREAWERYRLPVAITELHLGCTREEQLRWIREAWIGAHEAEAEGVDVRAVTFWSLFGSFFWNCLVTRDNGFYEPGAFDVRSDPPRATAIACSIRELADHGAVLHPTASAPGWWRRPERLIQPIDGVRRSTKPASGRPLLIVGANGTLAQALIRACRARGLAAVAAGRGTLDVTRRHAVHALVAELEPWAVINAAGYVRVDDAESDRDRCFALNVDGPVHLAEACAESGARFLTYSSDLVFDGRQQAPYRERHAVAPLSVYGLSKVEAERRVSSVLPAALIVRTSAFFGPEDQANFVTMALRALASGDSFHAATDAIVSPTYVPDLVDASLDLLIDGADGLFHLANRGETSWADLAKRAAALAHVSDARLVAVPSAELAWRAPRPPYGALATERGVPLPDLDDALARYVRDRGYSAADRSSIA